MSQELAYTRAAAIRPPPPALTASAMRAKDARLRNMSTSVAAGSARVCPGKLPCCVSYSSSLSVSICTFVPVQQVN
jgi:hypothetical protein